MGGRPTVSISDYDMIKDAMNKDEFANRPNFQGTNKLRGAKKEGIPGFGTPGIILGNGPRWLEVRRYSLRQVVWA